MDPYRGRWTVEELSRFREHLSRHSLEEFFTHELPREKWKFFIHQLLIYNQSKILRLILQHSKGYQINPIFSSTHAYIAKDLELLLANDNVTLKPEMMKRFFKYQKPKTFVLAQCYIKHGLRLKFVEPKYRRFIDPSLYMLENGVIKCQSLVKTLLALKSRRIRNMLHLDRFLVRELAFTIWVTRCDEPWQTALRRSQRAKNRPDECN